MSVDFPNICPLLYITSFLKKYLEIIVKWKLMTEVTVKPGLSKADKAVPFPNSALSNCSASGRRCVLWAGLEFYTVPFMPTVFWFAFIFPDPGCVM